jgi:hypothetical protein
MVLCRFREDVTLLRGIPCGLKQKNRGKLENIMLHDNNVPNYTLLCDLWKEPNI